MVSKIEMYKFGPAIWLAHLVLGITAALNGPALPFLRLNVGQTFSVIGLIFSMRSIGITVASIVTGFVLCRLTEGWQKLTWISSGLFTIAACTMGVPLINNVFMLTFVFCLDGFGRGMVDTADNSLTVFLLGPRKARPFLQSLHFMVSVGASLAPILARPFLMKMDSRNASFNPCNPQSVNNSQPVEEVLEPLSFSILLQSPLVIPYSIAAGIALLSGLIFAFLALRRPKFLNYKQKEDVDYALPTPDDLQVKHIRHQVETKWLFIGVFVFFYFLHCGTENVFWSHTTTYGMCSKLQMSAGEAALLTTVFFSGFLAGRGSGIVISNFLQPTTIISIELAGCVLTTGALAVWGETYSSLTYICIGCFGFSVSMIFASGISWLSDYIDVTGIVSATWFIGGMTGVSVIPVLAGSLIDQAVGPQGIMFFVLGSSLTAVLVFILLNFLAKFTRTHVMH